MNQMSKYDYNEFVEQHFKKFAKVILDVITFRKVESFVEKIIQAKKEEAHHKVDSNNEKKRWTTGLLGECAVEKYIGKSFINWSIGSSSYYHVPDLSSIGINCGVKTVERGKFPLIFKKSYKPEIIVIKDSNKELYICGYATVQILNKYQSDALILSPDLKKRGTKTGFYGYDKLLPPHTILELPNNGNRTQA